jgi:hypothetical protein
VVHGWRKCRKDKWLTRRLPSRVANWLISKATGFPVHDLGCTLKALRRGLAQELELYGEMHRFIPILAHWRGARCLEVVTGHHRRRFGATKYGLGRTFRVVLDLLTVRFMMFYFASPMKFFGMIGLWCWLASGLTGAATVAMKFGSAVDMTGNPLLLLTVFSAMAGMQFLCFGLLGEVAVRIYFQRGRRPSYTVRETRNMTRHGEHNPDKPEPFRSNAPLIHGVGMMECWNDRVPG